MKQLLSIAAIATFCFSFATVADAHCGACGTGDKDHSAHCKDKCKDKKGKEKAACIAKCKKKHTH